MSSWSRQSPRRRISTRFRCSWTMLECALTPLFLTHCKWYPLISKGKASAMLMNRLFWWSTWFPMHRRSPNEPFCCCLKFSTSTCWISVIPTTSPSNSTKPLDPNTTARATMSSETTSPSLEDKGSEKTLTRAAISSWSPSPRITFMVLALRRKLSSSFRVRGSKL